VHGRGGDAAREHEAILQALTDGDAAAAILAMRHHIESGFGVLQAAAAAAPHTG
jgi:DNA-binding GntR family transcriptional regulator